MMAGPEDHFGAAGGRLVSAFRPPQFKDKWTERESR